MILILQVKNLSYSYNDGHKALNNVSLEIEKGDMVCLLGKNGAGKSTLFLHFNGIFEPNEGEIFIEDKLLKYDKKSLMDVRQKVGIVFQNPDDQLFASTVEEDVAFGPLNIGLSQEETEKRVNDSLKIVGMEGFNKKAPHHLSGGQKKRVAIAGILAMKPDIMVLDEPTSGLDPMGASKILKLLKDLNKEGMTILISTHDVDFVPIYSNKVFIMDEGEIIKKGSPKEVFNDLEVIRGSDLRLPKITHLFEVLDKEDNIDFNGDYPLTISEGRKAIKDKVNK